MVKPNQQQVMSLLRSALSIVGTVMTLLGYGSDEQWVAISGVAVMIGPAIWGVFVHTQANAVATAAAIPEVERIEVKPTPAGAALKEAAGSRPEALVVFAPH
jgi:hypothetical protein